MIGEDGDSPDHPCSGTAGLVAKLNQMGHNTCALSEKSGGPPQCKPSIATEGGVHI